jgi:hypothetical protein
MSYLKDARGKSSEEGLGTKPFEAYVSSIDNVNESISFDGSTGPGNARIPHPMLGPNAWIRAIPDIGSRLVITTLASSGRRSALSYYSRMADEYISSYNSGMGVYRPLNRGEWELMTPKIAHIYGTLEGKLFLRGGPIQEELDPKKLRLRSRAPTYKRELHSNIDSEFNDEERFGVVVRHLDNNKKDRWIQIPLEGQTSDKDYQEKIKTKSFAKEYTRRFGRDGTPLIDISQGDVIDNDGKQVKQTKSGKNLRHKSYIYTKDGSDKTSIEIDEEGNVFQRSPGTDVILEGENSTLLAKYQKLDVQISKTASIISQASMEMSARATARFSGSSATLLGPNPSPTDPVIKGKLFMATVMVPLLTTLATHFTAGSEVGSFSAYKPLMKIVSVMISAMIPMVIPSLSTNVLTS